MICNLSPGRISKKFFIRKNNPCRNLVNERFFFFFFPVTNRCWILSKAFSASIEMINMVFILKFVNVVYHIDWFVDIKSLHPWDKSPLIMVYDPFNILLDSIWWILNLCSSVILACNILFFFFLVISLFAFGVREMILS